MNCRICGSENIKTIYKDVAGYKMDRTFDLVQCQDCDIIFTDPFLSEQEMKEHYDSEAIAFNGTGGDDLIAEYKRNKPDYWRNLGYYKRLDEITRLHPGAKSMLDIGTGAGIFPDLCRNSGMDAYGLELSQWGHKAATKDLGLNVVQATINDLKPGDLPKVDVVTMYDVLEHGVNPSADLAAVHKQLNKNGLLVVNLPNFESFVSRQAGKEWSKLIPPNHTYHFNRASLTKLLEKNGFEVVEATTNNGSPDEFAMEVALAAVGRLGVLVPSLKRAYLERSIPYHMNKNLSTMAIKTVRKVSRHSGFLVTPLLPILNRLKHGEGLHIVARKV